MAHRNHDIPIRKAISGRNSTGTKMTVQGRLPVTASTQASMTIVPMPV